VLARNFGVPAASFAAFPKTGVFMRQGSVPPPLPPDPAPGSLNTGARTHRYRLLAERPATFPGGSLRLVSEREFPISTTMTGALMRLKPGGLRELHWHPNGDEWLYVIEGQARMGVFAGQGQARTFDLQAGDVGYVPLAMGHYLENTGTGPFRFLETFKSRYFVDLSLDTWMALTPPELVEAHLKLDPQVMGALRKTKAPVVPS
jgi:oxalate decarboxylase